MKRGIISAILILLVASTVAVGKMISERLIALEKTSNKYLALFLMMNQWVRVKQQGKNLSFYFKKNGYKRIAVYGMGHIGQTLVDELKQTSIEVEYSIDQNAKYLYADIDIVTLDDKLEEVDAIVVTAITFFDEIAEKLSGRINCPIISLEDILCEV